jgi:hypothetical protein
MRRTRLDPWRPTGLMATSGGDRKVGRPTVHAVLNLLLWPTEDVPTAVEVRWRSRC